MRKASRVSGGHVVKRKARIGHECHACQRYIEPGEDYYQLNLERFFYGYITKPICKQCWQGRELKA